MEKLSDNPLIFRYEAKRTDQAVKGNPKPIDDPNYISLLIPTRARPDSLKAVFNSLEKTTHQKTAIDVWLYVDEDDDLTRNFINSLPPEAYSFKIVWVIGDRTKTQGEMPNILWQCCTSNAGIYFHTVDDCVFTTSNWDIHVREAFNEYPDRIILACPDEATAGFDQVTLMILSAEWINITGRILTSYFPYWFDDIWLDQVGQMIQRKVALPVQLNPYNNKGKTIRMRNLRFWNRFFSNTQAERIAEANRLRQAIYPEGTSEYRRSEALAAALIDKWKTQTKPENVAALIYTERTLGGEFVQSKPNARYLAIETEAVHYLFRKAQALVKQNRFAEALSALDNIQYASLLFTNVEYARALCWQRLGRLDEAQKAIAAELRLNPENPAALRLLSALDHHQFDTSELIEIGVESLQPEVVGENVAVTQLQLSPLDEIHIRLMPITLRLQTVRNQLAVQPIHRWPAASWEILTRFLRRRIN